MENQETKKYELNKVFNEEKKLKFFFVCVRTGNLEKFTYFVDYDHERGFKRLAESLPKVPPHRVISHGDYKLAEDVLKNINTEGITIVKEVVKEVPVEKKPTKEQFINNITLVAEEMVEGEDAKKLKKIIEKIKI